MRIDVGAFLTNDGVLFRVCAPTPEKVELVLLTENENSILPMEQKSDHWETFIEGLGAGSRYRYRINGQEERADPATKSMVAFAEFA